MAITREEAAEYLSRYDSEYYTPQCREAHQLAIEVLRQEEPQRWIPVKEKLPQEYVSVLVCIPSDHPLPMVREAYFANGSWAARTWIYSAKDITHWMPLPEPPKGE